MSSKGDIFDQISTSPKADIFDKVYQEPISKTRSVISAPVKGAVKGAEELSQLQNPLEMAISQLLPKQESVLSKLTEKFLPTRKEAAEGFLERTGKLAPAAALGGSGIVNSLLQAAGGGALGELAKEEGLGQLGQGVSEAVGMGIPGIARAVGKKALSLAKAPVETMKSGLTKPRAVDAKFAEKGVITPDQQKKSITKLNEQASKLSRQTVEKELPLAKQIEEGVDFEGRFEKNFGSLQKMAETANPEIDLTPVSEFMSSTGSKYRGIPKLHPEAEAIKKEIKAFGNRAPRDLKSALRTYRSNNKKIKNIYEKSRIEGKQQEYVDFLVDYNRSIAKSFEQTLPEDSAWLKEFKDLNKDYKNYKDTLQTLSLLKPIYGGNITPANVAKLADDPKTLKKLQLAMGDKGASEIQQIAQDLRTARQAIKRIPAKEIKVWDKILPLSIFIPHGTIPGSILSAGKSLDWAKRGYGWFLSTPARRTSYSNALKSLNEGNVSLYLKSSEELNKLTKEDSQD